MKKKGIVIAIVIFVVLSILALGIMTYIRMSNEEYINYDEEESDKFILNDDGTIYFEDSKLEEYIKMEIYKDKIYPKDAEKVKYLIFSFAKFDSLIGLEYFKNLEELSMTNCGIKDLSFITQFKKLKHITMKENGIYDITPLKKNKNLRTIDVSNNNIKDIKPLLELEHLVSLPRIHGNTIMNYDLFEDKIDQYHFNLIEEYDNLKRDAIVSMIENRNIEKCEDFTKECVIENIYQQDKETMDNYKYALSETKEFVKNNIKKGMSDIEKEREIVNYIVNKLDYDYEAASNAIDREDYYYSFKTGKGVCENYSNMFNLLASKSGLESYAARSIREDPIAEGHEWNIVKLDDKYYHIDVTWYDSRFDTRNINMSTNDMDEVHVQYPFDKSNLTKIKISKESMDRDIVNEYFSIN